MADYTKEEWQRLIEKYNRELLSAYASAPTPNSPPSDNTASEPATDPTPPPPTDVIPSDSDSELSDIGYLQIRVSTEDQASPIAGAVVTVTHQNGSERQLDRTLITDRDGLTEIIELATKDRALSLVPGNPSPYAVYTVNVAADGYFTKDFVDLPIYGGVTAIQSVSMIPLPEEGSPDIVLTYPQSGPLL